MAVSKRRMTGTTEIRNCKVCNRAGHVYIAGPVRWLGVCRDCKQKITADAEPQPRPAETPYGHGRSQGKEGAVTRTTERGAPMVDRPTVIRRYSNNPAQPPEMTCPECGMPGRYDHDGEWRHLPVKPTKRQRREGWQPPVCPRESKL
jgi:hypothetical protein